MMSEICPVCEEKIEVKALGENMTESQLCNGCAIARFFLDDEREIEYRTIVKERVKELKKLFKEDYNDTLHTDMVQQIVRCEIAITRYEALIANDEESQTTAEYLKAERAHWNKLAEKLHMTIKSFRGDTRHHKHEFSDDFETYLKQMMASVTDE